MILEKTKNGLYKTFIDDNTSDYEKGGFIWSNEYNKKELRYIRTPRYKIVKIRRTKNGIFLYLQDTK